MTTNEILMNAYTQARRDTAKSREEVDAHFNWKKGTLEKYETCKVDMPLEVAIQLSKLYKIKIQDVVKELEKSPIESDKKAEARDKIQKAIGQNGPYTHNIIGLVLSGLKDIDMANDLIDENDLDRVYGIQKVRK